mmetsp:Transcript_14841/g.18813  ORF Transcript_14841/g.18813 Transcript_14841/m.18813 type:complete len:126 (+) Transcript_14841:1-378(+)
MKMNAFVPSTYFVAFLYTSLICVLLPGKVIGECPCFTAETLSSFTSENTNATASCKTEINGIGLWMNKPSWWNESDRWWHPYSFHAYTGSCLMDGDIMVPTTSVEEDEHCRGLIVARCEEIGLLR